jgi:hypothetical protein
VSDQVVSHPTGNPFDGFHVDLLNLEEDLDSYFTYVCV